MVSGVIVAALITTNGPDARPDSAWMVRAVSSLPEPGAPANQDTGVRGATRSTV